VRDSLIYWLAPLKVRISFISQNYSQTWQQEPVLSICHWREEHALRSSLLSVMEEEIRQTVAAKDLAFADGIGTHFVSATYREVFLCWFAQL